MRGLLGVVGGGGIGAGGAPPPPGVPRALFACRAYPRPVSAGAACQLVLSSHAQAKNRAPAPVQITAEQILREASDRQIPEAPKIQMRVMNEEELEDFRAVKRKEFETMLRTKIHKLGVWLRYAHFEESQKCFDRARSVFERALDFDYTQDSLWRKYAEMEMRNKFINHARNVWDRAVTYLPRVDQLWLRYAYMEEMAGSVPGARAVFERWTKWVRGPCPPLYPTQCSPLPPLTHASLRPRHPGA